MLILSDIEQLQQDVVDACQILYKEGIWERFGEGHPSVRIPGTDKIIVPGHNHPYGRGMGGVRSIEDVIVVNTKLKKISGKYDSMNELTVHTAIYRERPDVGGLIYSHPPYCDLFAEVMKPIPKFGPNIPLWDSNGPIADEKRGKQLAKKLGNKDAILLRDPCSLVGVAPTLREAVAMVYWCEKQATHEYKASLLGTIPPGRPIDLKFREFSTHVDFFDTDVSHGDLWRFLYEKNIKPA